MMIITTTRKRARQLSIRYTVYDVRGQMSTALDALGGRRPTYRESPLGVTMLATAHRCGSADSGPGWVGLPVFPAWMGSAITAVRPYVPSAASRPGAVHRGTTIGVATYFTVARRPQINA